jgi:quinoprotein glucose dehydrogenase
MNKLYFPLIAVLFLMVSCTRSDKPKPGNYTDWPRYGGNAAGNRYSTLDQINISNVNQLQVAWTYSTVDPPNPNDSTPQKAIAIQCQPIVIDGVLYGTSGELKLFALNAATGEQKWKFEPGENSKRFNTNRGVVYWENKDDRRILYTVGSNLYAVNADDGKLVNSFGKNGIVDLREGLQEGLEHDINNLSVTASSPGVVYKNTIVLGSSVSESGDAAPGYIRAFDIPTGKLKWVFHTIPRPGQVGYETWPKDAWKEVGGVNNWSGLVVDDKRGMVFFGTGSPSSDFYGGNRKGANLFATSIMALEAETGKMKWYYQTIHHDLWDRDHSTPPNLTTVTHNGKKVDVVVQATKDGLVYVLDRDKGTSLFPVEETPVPTKGLPGEHPYPTQKYPSKPLPFSEQEFTAEDITNISPQAHEFVKKQYLEYRSDHKFTPPSTKGTILFGYSGGAEWGGNSIDPDGILYQNSNNDPWILQMIDTASRNKEIASVSHGNALYLTNCASCHGPDRRGSGTQFPNLVMIGQRRSPEEILSVVKTGSGRMPSFQHLSESDRKAIVGFLLNPRAAQKPAAADEHAEDPTAKAAKKKDFGFEPRYVNRVWKKLTDQDGYPGVKPPWGTLNAIDLNTGEYLWRVPLGEFPELTKKGIPITGTESYGGPISTAGGLIFIAGTKDERIRAFDKKTGKVVWEYQLPAGGFATPITYQVNGKQYVVIAAGGGRGQKAGGDFIAFALK